MSIKLTFEVKEAAVNLIGSCFWFWNSFYSFLDSSGVPRALRDRYPRESFNKYQLMRNLFEDLETAGNTETISSLVSNLYRLRGPVDRDQLDVDKAKRLLEEFRELLGADPIEAELAKRARDKARADHQGAVDVSRSVMRQLEELNDKFISLSSSTGEVTPQQRGFELERLFFSLLEHCEFDYTPPYRPSSSEQIDGHFQYEKFDYLVEIKWTAAPTKQSELSVFDGKIRGKAQSTRGLCLSANGFDQGAITKFSGDAPRIVLMTGEDLALVLSGQVLFADAMKAKIDAIVRKGQILLPVRTVLS
jgi:restriction endonuclease